MTTRNIYRKKQMVLKVAFYLFTIILFLLVVMPEAKAEDMRKIVQLSGYWKFSIGTDDRWADPSFDDSKWDQIRVPDKWEDQGYSDYNGYAWYRKKFKMEETDDNTPLYLVLGRIDDADEVYLNGKLIGKSGNFPPEYITAYNKVRRYHIPKGILKMNAVNTVAVKVYDSYLEGGIVSGPAGIFISEDNEFLDYNLSGQWKFHPGNNKKWASVDFDDNTWNTIFVPAEWENEGYPDYDGYGWYRKTFRMPQNIDPDRLYLSLGKIDDVDDVYLNGKYIGSVYDLRKDGEYRKDGYEYNARRVYRIPTGLLKPGGMNEISVRVYDGQLRGGIYEGPIGLMTEKNYKKYRNKYYFERSFWDYLDDMFNIE